MFNELAIGAVRTRALPNRSSALSGIFFILKYIRVLGLTKPKDYQAGIDSCLGLYIFNEVEFHRIVDHSTSPRQESISVWDFFSF